MARTIRTKIIFEGRRYTACIMADGSLVVTRNKKGGGVRLIGEDARHWRQAIQTAIDDDEAHLLCRAIATAIEPN
ncbi:MAG: hypothetical protein ACM31O_14045 [Bacteroidota bacterium]